MNSKIVIGVIILVLAVVAIYLYTKTESTNTSSGAGQPSTDISVQSSEASTVVSNSYSTLIQEELNKLSVEQTDFNTQTTDSIANDMSQFYYG